MTRRKTRCVCVECGKHEASRPHDLCFDCYFTPAIREKFGIRKAYRTSSEIADRNGEQPPPAEPTPALAGSAEKQAELAARALRGEQLFHENDEVRK